MGAMPSPVEKDSILQKLDWFTKLAGPVAVEQLLKDIENKKPRPAANKVAREIGLTPAERIHLREWLGNPNGWELDGGELSKLLKDELVEALKRITADGSADKGLPLDCFWVCYPGQDPKVQIRIQQRAGATALGFDILTPPPDEI